MDSDAKIVLGLFFVLLSMPSFVTAWIDQRFATFPCVLLIAAAVLIIPPWSGHPGGYTVAELSNMVYAVIGDILH